MPYNSKLPLFDYGVKGSFEYFQAILKPLLTYRDLKSEVFQAFREFGNTFLVVDNLEKALLMEESINLVQAAPFLGITSALLRECSFIVFSSHVSILFRVK
jgi:cytoplasmic FMR1 interacting protein